ncbi:DNA repair protein RecO [Yeosuana marina]|uniref:DNA repair protein RecO n=1 Tax=Yeosuana marina TaxID=1565536 RepID=UPI0030EF9272|tara:strand:- start:3035 stop:3754 length:720 start_codon:yes stop_codon:yes gene_type:complete
MIVSTHAIVISKLRYRDHDLIVKCYTQQYGVLSFLLRGVLKSKKGLAKTAYFQLLTQLQLVIVYNPNRSLHSIKEAKLNHLYSSLHSNVSKSAIVMFLAEVLSSILKEEEENRTLFSYIETTLLWLDTHTECSNFHLLFLLNLTKYLGFYPENTTVDFPFFNLQDGKFQSKPMGPYTISGDNFNLLKQLLDTKFDELSQLKINSKQRQAFLNMMLQYYELHLGDFKKPKSLQVLNQVFG